MTHGHEARHGGRICSLQLWANITE